MSIVLGRVLLGFAVVMLVAAIGRLIFKWKVPRPLKIAWDIFDSLVLAALLVWVVMNR